MKIVLTDATGVVATEILLQLLRREDVDEVTCLTRQTLAVESAKLRTVLHEDFMVYDEFLALDLAQHDALIWAIGGKASDEAEPALAESAAVACAMAIATYVTHRFRFGYLSGPRHGRTEAQLKAITERVPNFRATCYRPARILPKNTSALVDTLLSPIAVRVDWLALTMIEESVRNVAEHYAVLKNSTIRRIADPSH